MSVDLSPEERAKIVAERADVKYGPFASLHEAYGVLAEEFQESYEVITEANEAASNHDLAKLLFDAVRKDDPQGFLKAAIKTRMFALHQVELLERIKAEQIDVIAVCDRIIAQWGEK